VTQIQSYTWFIAPPPTPSPVGGVPGEAFNAGNALGCTPCFLSQADLLALMDRLLPISYLDPIKHIGPGYELYQAAAKVFERCSIGVGILECSQFILSATGGAYATARVSFIRPNTSHGAVTIKAGAIVSTSRGGLRFVLQKDVAFGAGDLATGGAVVQAVNQNYQYNVPGPKTTARGETRPGEIDTIDLPLMDPPYGDPTVTVTQIQDAVGGVAPALDALGHDRGIDRAKSEGDPQYAARIRALPDTVSPAAMKRLLARAFTVYTLAGANAPVFIECWWVGFQTCWSAPDRTYTGPTGSFQNDYDPNLFVWSDPRRSPPLRDLWLSGDFERGAFVVLMPRLMPILDVGGMWSDPATGIADLKDVYGQRALSAWSIPQDYAGAPGFCWSGYDIGAGTLFKGVWDAIEQSKPAGAAVAFFQEGY